MSEPVDPVAKHRREVWLHIVLPVVLSAGLIVLSVVGLFTAAIAGWISPEQITTISSVLLTICILLPLILVMLLVDIGVLALVWLVSKAPTTITPPMRNLRQKADVSSTWVVRQTERLARPAIAFNARWTRWERFAVGLVGANKDKLQKQIEPIQKESD